MTDDKKNNTQENIASTKLPRSDVDAFSEDTVDSLISSFEAAAHVDDDGNEYWYARDLSELLEYTRWENFVGIINKAKIACEQAKHSASDHFADVSKMIELGKGGVREIEDFALSRYASYLIAQNGDTRKKPIAFAQTYFAIQTRRQEIKDQEDRESHALSEEEQRLRIREEVKVHNKHLASAAKNAGVIKHQDYAIFQAEGYRGLYGGLDAAGIRRQKGLKKNQAILDHMGSTELAANLFRATQTEEKLLREDIQGKAAANNAHKEVGHKVRQTIKDIGGTMPEKLPVEEDIKKVERRLKKAEKKKIAND